MPTMAEHAHWTMDRSASGLYRLGLPAWAFPGWRGVYFDDKPSALASYASVFNAVEGNTTFYRIPDESTVARWNEAVESTELQFSFKLPATVTHERGGSIKDLEQFLAVIRPLESHLYRREGAWVEGLARLASSATDVAVLERRPETTERVIRFKASR